jgi:putative copper export protein
VLARTAGITAERRVALDRLAADAGFFACTLIVIVALPRLWFQAQAFVEAGESPMTMVSRVRATTWGITLTVQLSAASLGAAAFGFAHLRRRGAWIVASIAVAGLTISPAFMGHPIAAEQRAWLHVGADWLHVVSAGGWVGALTLLTIAARRCSSDVVAALIASFHRVAFACVLGVLVTGTTSLVLRLPKLGDLFGSDYGTVLFVKIGCVAIVAALGAWHSQRAEGHTRDGGSVVGSLTAEVLLAAAAIMATAVLVGTEPPGL